MNQTAILTFVKVARVPLEPLVLRKDPLSENLAAFKTGQGVLVPVGDQDRNLDVPVALSHQPILVREDAVRKDQRDHSMHQWIIFIGFDDSRVSRDAMVS